MKWFKVIMIFSFIIHCFGAIFKFNNTTIDTTIFSVSIIAFFISSLSFVFLKFKDKIITYLNIEINTEFMVLTRVLYAILCLFSAIQHLTLVPYGIEPYNFLRLGIPTPSFLAYFLSILYIVSLLMLLFGYRIRIAWILTFVIGGLIIPFSLEIFLKNTFNFYAIFISPQVWLGRKSSSGSWAIVLMAFSSAVLMTAAGIHKLLDPVWFNGLGFYYSLNIPFFPNKFLWQILDIEWLMVLFNWTTIIVEIVALPLILFKSTRIYGILCVLGLGLFLAFGMSGIGVMGGPIVFCMVLLFLSVTSIPKIFAKKYNFLNLNLFNLFSVITNKLSFLSSPKLGFIIFIMTTTSAIHHVYDDFRSNLFYMPPVFGNYSNTQPKLINEDNPIISRVDYINNKILRRIQVPIHWKHVWSIALFDYHHLFDRVIFKIEFENEDGLRVENKKYYNEDGSTASEQPLIANEKFLLSCFRMMEAIRTEPYVSSKRLSPRIENEIIGLVKYSKNKNTKSSRAIISVKMLNQPFKYEGNKKPWTNDNWIEFYAYDLNKNKGKILNEIPTYQYEKLDVDAFKNKILIPNY